MSALKIAKFVVFIFSILLIACFCLIISKITDTHLKSNHKNKIVLAESKNTTLQLDKNETISNIFSCHQYICISTNQDNQKNKILVIEPQSGQIIQTITLKRE